ncbi:MAG: acylphosphatase [Gammaproteobacteria bacterium]|nr:acylphosphatase [Gammaproteobacteria bacterium]
MTDRAGKRFIVFGQVQGVVFRASTAEEAERLGLSGSAVNLPDGTVEVVAFGEADHLRELAGWLAEGPPLAQVHRVESEPVDIIEAPPDDAFRIG